MVTVEGSDGGLLPPASPTPVAVAVSVTSPASMSTWVTVCGLSAVQVTESPMVNPPTGTVGHVTVPIRRIVHGDRGEVDVADVRDQVRVGDGVAQLRRVLIGRGRDVGALADRDLRLAGPASMISVDGSDGGLVPPVSPVPVAVAVSLTKPRATSLAVTV